MKRFLAVFLTLVLVLGATGTSLATEKTTLTVLSEGAMNLGAGKLEELLPTAEADCKANPNDSPTNFRYAFNQYLLAQQEALNISVDYLDWGWAEPLAQKETAAFLAGQGPDIILGETQMPGFAAQGVLEPFPDWLDKEVRASIVPGAWEPMEFGGKIYGVAIQPGVNILCWNRDLLRQSGVDEKIIQDGPKTWDELIAACELVSKAGQDSFYAGGVYAGPNNGGYLRFGPFMQIAGGGFVNEKGEPVFNSEGNVKAFELLRSLSKLNPEGFLVNSSEGAFFDPANKSQVAFAVDGPWRIQLAKDLKMDLGFGPLPTCDGGKPGNVTIGAAFLSVPTYSKNKDAAFKYLWSHLAEDAQRIIAQYQLRPVVNTTVGDQPDYQQANPALYNVYNELKGNVVGLPTFAKDNTKAWQVLGDAMVKTALSDVPVQDILNEAQAAVEQILK